MWWQTFFDETYRSLWSHLHPPDVCEQEAEAIAVHLGLGKGDRVLDAPCGYGRISLPLAKRGLRITAVDFSEELLAHGRAACESEQLADNVDWIQADLRGDVALPTGHAAAVNLFSSIGYGTEEEDLSTLRTLARYLREGGALLLETMHRDAIVHRQALGDTAGVRGPRGITLRERSTFDPIPGILESTWKWSSPTTAGKRTSRIRLYSVTELVALVLRAGFRDVQCSAGIGGSPMNSATLHERLCLTARI